jgi:hypothetical protein
MRFLDIRLSWLMEHSTPEPVAECTKAIASMGGYWIQTTPGKGWFTILRLYSPLPPFFDKSWKAGEIEPAR